MFAKDRSRLKKKNVVIDKLIDFFDKFFSITNKSLFTKKEIEYKKDEDNEENQLMVAEDSEEYKNE